MYYKLWVKDFFLYSFSTLFIIFSFTIIIDPYDVTSINLLKIKHKMTRDNRLQKINQIKRLKNIDNIILGSSRAERLNPQTVSKLIGGYTYTFGLGGANIEDALGVLLYLQKINKLPKNIILAIDFASFRKDLMTPSGFYKIPELNFLDKKNVSNQNNTPKLFSLNAFRSAVKTFKHHLKEDEPVSYINSNGFFTQKEIFHAQGMEKIKKVANEYYTIAYKEGNLKFSENRFNYLKKIVSLATKHNIKLYTMLTPVHEYQYNMIIKNKVLYKKLLNFKTKLLSITPYYDAMTINKETKDMNNFSDAVHTNIIMGNKLLSKLLKPKVNQ